MIDPVTKSARIVVRHSKNDVVVFNFRKVVVVDANGRLYLLDVRVIQTMMLTSLNISYKR